MKNQNRFRGLELWIVPLLFLILSQHSQVSAGVITTVGISSDGKYALSGSDSGVVRIWEITSGKNTTTRKFSSGFVPVAKFSPDGTSVLSNSPDNGIILWNRVNGKTIKKFTGHSAIVTSMNFSDDGRRFVSGARDHLVKVWDVEKGTGIKTFKGHSSEIADVALSGDGIYVISGSRDNTAKLWSVDRGKTIKTFNALLCGFPTLGFSKNNKFALAVTYGEINLWAVDEGKIRTLSTNTYGYSTSSSVSMDGQYALYGLEDHTIEMWELTTGKLIKHFADHSSWVTAVAFSNLDRNMALPKPGSSTGKEQHSSSNFPLMMISGSTGSVVKVWDINHGDIIRTYNGHLGDNGKIGKSE